MKRFALPATAAATAALLLTGCTGGADGSSGSAAPSARTYGCLTADQAAKGAFGLEAGTAAGGTLDAYYRDSDAGGAEVGIVLSHQLGGSLCDWTPYLAAFTAAGYAVLPFGSEGDVTDGIRAAAGYLKGKGVTKLALIGASKGGTASLVAARLASPLPIAAVVTLSAPETNGQFNGALAVRNSTVPTLFTAEEGDSPFNAAARTLYDESVSPHKELKLYPGSSHGAPLLTEGAMPDVQAFLAAYAPPTG
ncbi:hypothetical protein [Kitasatospora cinereorecta]|uniref:Alpha/beta hydrolase n=1 Tax=Kitasatospora cinereorecta TaxID=285560 RepID=A0ABW0VLS0_9ACTN